VLKIRADLGRASVNGERGRDRLARLKWRSPLCGLRMGQPAGSPDGGERAPSSPRGPHLGPAQNHVRRRRHRPTTARLRDHGGEVLREIVQYEDMFRLRYLRPAGIIIALAEQGGSAKG
jgi:hypothetical protein